MKISTNAPIELSEKQSQDFVKAIFADIVNYIKENKEEYELWLKEELKQDS